ncbi:Hemerythrin HHE cation binding domain-containing protein [Amycolatopsis marina]|uniref:Hemerythrin HHE cation binding domain-containing protein n=1 Tax=Amycolatopsis marina TaxID=490629 RepID=A0A1I0VZ24_9PSEU|nr:hemerythrin domain-containing protein [Amycolatopsis marina]SFA81438.1 Hemerythrin HHE cation binding domain-containing protein [Amycolatopsis marina]
MAGRFEELMRGLRDATADRRSLRTELAALLVAHAEAEEQEVYPGLRRFASSSDEEVEHGEEEHAQINQALLAFLELNDVEGETYDEKLEELVEVVNHHTNEEEQTLLNDARTKLSPEERKRLGLAFLKARAAAVDAGSGRVERLRQLVAEVEGSLR